MKTKVAWAISVNNVTVRYDNQTHIISRQEPLATEVIAALREGRPEDIPGLVYATKIKIESYGDGAFKVVDGLVVVNGLPVHEGLSRKILQFRDEQLPHQPLVNFAAKLQKNPSYRAVNELFQFLEKNDHPITEDGNFIAYKRVRADFKDIHSGKFDNSVGNVLEMPRNQVNEDSTQTCSYGLHVANWHYAHTQFASHNPATDVMLEVEVDPADVVSIPVDYNQSKMRVCRYKVIGVVDKEHSSAEKVRYNPPSEEDEEEDDGFHSCSACGGECEEGYDVCLDCEDDVYGNSSDDEEEDDEEEDEEDDYPWEDELK